MRPARVLMLIGLLTAGAGLPGSAARAETTPLRVPDSAAPTFTVYTSRDGLGEEVWSTVGFGPDGFVWAGSASTLARFDGYRWSMTAGSPGRSLVRDMASDADGNLWAIFESEGLARFDGRRWQQAGEARFHQRFSTLGSGEEHELWVAHNHGMARLEGGQWVDHPEYLSSETRRPIALARTQNLFGGPREWLATADNGLWFRELTPDTGAWQAFEHPVLRAMAMTDLLLSDDGGHEELWAVSYGGGVARVRADGIRVWRSSDRRDALPSEAVYSAVESRDRSGERIIWMASRAGLLRFRGDQLAVFNRRHGLPSDALRAVKVQRGSDGVDAIWIATEAGLARATLSDSPWQTVSLLGANENGIFGVMLEPNGRGGERLWVGSAREGLAMLEDGNWRRFSAATGDLPDRPVRGIWRLPESDGRHRRVLAMPGEPLQEINDELRIRPIHTPWTLTRDTVANHMMARTVDGVTEWWAATNTAGVFRLRDGQWTAYPKLGDGERQSVNWIVEQRDAQGRSWLWAADTRGLARFDGNQWQRLPDSLRLPNDGFRAVMVQGEGEVQTLWASSSHHGLLRLDVSDPLNPRRLDDSGLPPPPDPTIYSALADSQGRIYVCTNNGVQQLTPLAGGDYSERVFRRRDGLVHDECNTNGQLLDRHDRYWVGTLGGLGLFDPGAQPPAAAAVAKPLHFTGLRVDGEVLPLPDDGRVELPAGARDLRVEYSLLTGQREGESRYRTHMVGYEADSGAWTSEHSRSFSALPPGDYLLRIEAIDFTGTAAEPRELRISVAPFWWQQSWLQALAVFALLLLGAATVLGYNRGLRAHQKTLRRQVSERTQDLHAANLRLTELSYLDPLTGVANRRRLTEAMRSAIERAAQQRKPIGLIVADVDSFKQYNDSHGHLAGDAALRAIAAAMDSVMREQDLVARFGGEEFACLMEDADLVTVTRVAERMRALVEALPPRSLGNDSHTLTISAGVLSCVPSAGQSPDELLHAADQALYEAKAAGRNQVRAAADT